ncbi:MAG TPA: AMP-binding protein [Bryobacteraceae bacterium]|nr:AMP-binding protein [Bryobacteraceae bacterium]
MSRWIWEPTEDWIARTNVRRFMDRLGIRTLPEFLAWSTEDLARFWAEMVREMNIVWERPFDKVLDDSAGIEWTKWFIGGRLNIASNCLDRHATATNPAIIWEGESGVTREISFARLLEDSNRLANALRARGIGPGDRVALCMPMVPEVVTILYACFKLGAIAVPIFAGFGPGAIASRLEDSGAKIVFTADKLVRRGVAHVLPEKIGRPDLILFNYDDQSWGDLLRGHSADFDTPAFDSETPALILYTSGTTGKPKGTVHTHAGALAQVSKEIWLGFDHQPQDRFWWLSDIGWMMGPWSIIGNHNFGGTIFMYDGAPDHPGPDRLWRMIERHGITTFGISPTAIRVLMRSDSAKSFAMPSLRLLGSTGEPWDEASYLWFFNNVGKRRCPIMNISGGTEIIGGFLMPMPIQPLKPCTLGGPAPGMAIDVVDDNGQSVRGRTGHLVCTKPAPSMTRGFWGDRQRYLDTYWSRFPGVWFHGDWASIDEDGCWFLHGRSDESMNVAGRKLGPAEVEAAAMEHPAVREAACIGVPDDVKGECPVAFVVLKEGFDDSVRSAVVAKIAEVLGPAFRPRDVVIVPELPKTQSGKVVRRLIRRRYLGEDPGDTSTVQNPQALEAIRHA